MPTPTTYSFTIAQFDLTALTNQVRTSSIIVALDSITSVGTEVELTFKDVLSSDDQNTLNTLISNYVYQIPNPIQTVAVASNPAFASKNITTNGVTKNLFKRVVGIKASLNAGDNTILYTCTFAWAKLLAMEVVGGEGLDTVSLYILDTANGTFSGVPNFQLNQFGFAANVAKDFYQSKSEFDADIYSGLQIKVIYNSISAKPVGINFVMNEVK